jgi:hypothetical protein
MIKKTKQEMDEFYASYKKWKELKYGDNGDEVEKEMLEKKQESYQYMNGQGDIWIVFEREIKKIIARTGVTNVGYLADELLDTGLFDNMLYLEGRIENQLVSLVAQGWLKPIGGYYIADKLQRDLWGSDDNLENPEAFFKEFNKKKTRYIYHKFDSGHFQKIGWQDEIYQNRWD